MKVYQACGEKVYRYELPIGTEHLEMITCTRRIEFDAAHRVMRHESKCRNLHGHRYAVELTCTAPELDPLGRVVDFGSIKDIVGGWIDQNLDHGAVLNKEDVEIASFLQGRGHRVHLLEGNPTAEVLAQYLFAVASQLLPSPLTVVAVRVWETPNCWAYFDGRKGP